MKRKLLIIISCFCVVGICGCVYYGVSNYDIVSDIQVYLENKYNQKFLMNAEIENENDKDYLCSYSFSPESNPEIIFTAGMKKEEHIFPFLFPRKSNVFYDTYFEGTKDYIVSRVIPEEPFVVNNISEIATLTDSIYEYMKQINDELGKNGFSTTKFTCSITVDVLVRQELEKINFYILDKTKIYDCLSKAFSGE